MTKTSVELNQRLIYPMSYFIKCFLSEHKNHLHEAEEIAKSIKCLSYEQGNLNSDLQNPVIVPEAEGQREDAQRRSLN